MFALVMVFAMLFQTPPAVGLIDARAQAAGRVYEPTRASGGSKGAVLHVRVSIKASQPVTFTGTLDFEFLVTNTGTEPLRLPRIVGVRSFEPHPLQTYSVHHFRLVARTIDLSSCKLSATADLYGHFDDPDSMITLPPNQALKILAHGVSNCTATTSGQKVNVIATADLARETISIEAGDIVEHVDDIGFAQSSIISMTLR